MVSKGEKRGKGEKTSMSRKGSDPGNKMAKYQVILLPVESWHISHTLMNFLLWAQSLAKTLVVGFACFQSHQRGIAWMSWAQERTISFVSRNGGREKFQEFGKLQCQKIQFWNAESNTRMSKSLSNKHLANPFNCLNCYRAKIRTKYGTQLVLSVYKTMWLFKLIIKSRNEPLNPISEWERAEEGDNKEQGIRVIMRNKCRLELLVWSLSYNANETQYVGNMETKF